MHHADRAHWADPAGILLRGGAGVGFYPAPAGRDMWVDGRVERGDRDGDGADRGGER